MCCRSRWIHLAGFGGEEQHVQFLAKNNNKHRNRLFISSDEKLAQSTVMHLEQKLRQVDDLLESLQEEEHSIIMSLLIFIYGACTLTLLISASSSIILTLYLNVSNEN